MQTDFAPVKEQRTEQFHYLDPNPTGNPVFILLHGLGSNSTSWGYQIPVLLGAKTRPIPVDLPGFGKSIYSERNWNIRIIAGKTAEFVRRISPTPCTVVGISMGGTIALQLCLDYPELVERLVLVSTFATLRPKRLHECVYLISRFIKANLRGVNAQAEMVARRIFPKPEQEVLRQTLKQQILQADPNAYVSAMRALGLFDVTKRLHEISVPTLVISGKDDTTVPLENQSELTRKIHGARQVIIPGGGHAIIAEQPELFNQVLLEFLAI
jgi:Predicted hydrolases or acyltransferases (alpha/beta hydrolase superfamily)